jgi:hypothetical protein
MKIGRVMMLWLFSVALVQAQYPINKPSSHLFRIFEENGKWGLSNSKTGKIVIPPIYERISSEVDASAIILAKLNGKYGLIDTMNNVVLPFNYERLGEYSCGLSAFREKERWGYIDIKGIVIIFPKYKMAENFSCGKASVTDDKNNEFYIDIKGNKVIDSGFAITWEFKDDYAIVALKDKDRFDNEWNIIDKKGVFQLKELFCRIIYEGDGSFRLQKRLPNYTIKEARFYVKTGAINWNIESYNYYYWKEYKSFQDTLRLISQKIYKTGCFCEYPRVIDYVQNRWFDDAYLLKTEFFSHLKEETRFNQTSSGWNVVRFCPVCKSELYMHCKEFREMESCDIDSFKIKAKTTGVPPKEYAPCYITGLFYKTLNSDMDYQRIRTKLFFSTKRELIQYLFEKSVR